MPLRRWNAKATLIFSAKILACVPYLKIKVLTIHLTNDIVSFEQLGLGVLRPFQHYLSPIKLLVGLLWKALYSEALYSHELNSTSSG